MYFFNLLCDKNLDLAKDLINKIINNNPQNANIIFSSINGLVTYCIVYEVGTLTHDLNVKVPKLSSDELVLIHTRANFFILHELFANKNKDASFYAAKNIFIEILKAVSQKKGKQSYQSIINKIISAHPASSYKIGFFVIADKHPLRSHLDSLAEIEENILESIIPEYLSYLAKPEITSLNSEKSISLAKELNTAISNTPKTTVHDEAEKSEFISTTTPCA